MLDLNIDAGLCVGSASYEDIETDEKGAINTADADSVTSTTTSTTNNAAFAANELDFNSSTRRNSISALNLSILHENVIEIEDCVNNGVINNRNELQLFPVGAFSSSPVVDRAKYWLNLSLPEVSGGGGVELGIFKAQLSSNHRVQKPPVKKSRRGPRSRSSQYRGVTFYRNTGRWESHIWDCGKQVYLGGFDTAHAAAGAYDRAAIKFRGVDADINFNVSDYEEDMKQVDEEFVQILRRQSSVFSRGSSKFRSVTMNECGQLEALMGQFVGKKACDKATVIYHQIEAIGNSGPRSDKKEKSNTSTEEGSGRNLDLNLGISSASDGLQRNDTTKNWHFPYASSESPDGKRIKVKASSASFPGRAMITKYTPLGAGKERATAMSAEAIPSTGFSNWPRKMQGHGVFDVVPIFSSAASSGFSSTTTMYSHSLISSTSRTPLKGTAFHCID